jgi:hypothetical protein
MAHMLVHEAPKQQPDIDQPDNTSATGITPPRTVDRGLTDYIAPVRLRPIVWSRALSIINRFRVVTTMDIAAGVFPERSLNAALTAAQRTMYKLAKANLVRRYVTDRHQHVYGLTEAGARWLLDHDIEATSSVRRVAEMSNPEHQLWSSLITLCCEARGLPAMTEGEALRELSGGSGKRYAEFLTVELHDKPRSLRPDVLAFEEDGATWIEIDRSKRGADREAALVALILRIGSDLTNGIALRRVVVLARNPRIMNRALGLVRARISEAGDVPMTSLTERRFVEVEPGIFDVRALTFSGERGQFIEQRVGQVIVQLLPTWLPMWRQSGECAESPHGWLDENYLPYRRAARITPWRTPESPLLDAIFAANRRQ